MLRATLRNLNAHKVRLLLSALAVVLGVAFVAGTLVFTDTLKQTFDSLFTDTTADVVVEPTSPLEGGYDTGGLSIPASVLTTVRGVDGVAKADGDVTRDGVQVIGSDGKVVGVTGAPTLGTSWLADPQISPYRLVSGRGPQVPGEVAIDQQTATNGDLAVGSDVRLVTPVGPATSRVVGVFRYGTSGNLAGASLTAFDLRTAQQTMLDGKDAYTSISVLADPGVSQSELAARVRAAVPADLTVRTGQEVIDSLTKQVNDGLQFINIFLLVFAFVALFVGTFIILNTFSIIVASRTRELALLRAVGATRRQVTVSLMAEAVAVGLVGATVGIGVGVLLAVGLEQLFRVVGFAIPTGGLSIRPSVFLASYAVGLVVTLVAAWVPARRAGRLPPVAALRDDVTLPQRSLRARLVLGLVIVAVGVASLTYGLTSGRGSTAASAIGLGAVLVFIGVATFSPSVSRPVVALLGAPLRRATVGRIAVENARRNSRRTASTASALMIGLALVSMMSVIGASTKASVDSTVDGVIGADFIVSSTRFQPFPTSVAGAMAAVDGVATVSQVRISPARVDGGTTSVTAIDPATVTQVVDLATPEGSLSALTPDGVALDVTAVENDGLAVGDTVSLTLPTGQRDYRLEAVYDGRGTISGWVMSLAGWEAAGMPAQDSSLYVRLSPGADATAVRAALEAVVADYPAIQVQDRSELKQQIRGNVNQLLALIYALLALAVVIAVLGIVNTLALSVIERTREIGLLRAVGATRRQVRQMVRRESVVVALYGAVLGIVLGVAFGVALQRGIADQGFSVLAVPWLQLVLFLVLAVVVGILAAWWPARRAARLDVLRAVSVE